MRRTLTIILIIFLVLGLLLAVAFCVGAGYFVWNDLIGDPPGEGPKAEAGYKACAPVIDALERYKAEHGAYPETVDALTPDFLPDDLANPEDVLFTYKNKGESYELQFRYSGPGMNICTYTPETGWDCIGYY